MTGRKTRIESMYRLTIPGTCLNDDPTGNGWTKFLMTTEEMLELYQSIRDALGLGGDQ